jgi:hypothetical protein
MRPLLLWTWVAPLDPEDLTHSNLLEIGGSLRSCGSVAFDFASAVDEMAVLVEEECELDHAVEIAVWVGAPQEGYLWRGESDLGGAH